MLFLQRYPCTGPGLFSITHLWPFDGRSTTARPRRRRSVIPRLFNRSCTVPWYMVSLTLPASKTCTHEAHLHTWSMMGCYTWTGNRMSRSIFVEVPRARKMIRNLNNPGPHQESIPLQRDLDSVGLHWQEFCIRPCCIGHVLNQLGIADIRIFDKTLLHRTCAESARHCWYQHFRPAQASWRPVLASAAQLHGSAEQQCS